MNPLLAAALGSILRFLLAMAAGYLVEHGVWAKSDAEIYITAAVAGLLSLLWSLWNKYKDRIKFVTALAAPHATSEAYVEQLIADGAAPPLNLSKDRVPYLEGSPKTKY